MKSGKLTFEKNIGGGLEFLEKSPLLWEAQAWFNEFVTLCQSVNNSHFYIVHEAIATCVWRHPKTETIWTSIVSSGSGLFWDITIPYERYDIYLKDSRREYALRIHSSDIFCGWIMQLGKCTIQPVGTSDFQARGLSIVLKIQQSWLLNYLLLTAEKTHEIKGKVSSLMMNLPVEIQNDVWIEVGKIVKKRSTSPQT